jgi:hypothetical protein
MWASIVEDLVTVQEHASDVVRVPATLTDTQIAELRRTAALLRGQTLPATTRRVPLTDDAEIPERTEPLAVRFHRPIEVDLGEQVLELDQVEIVFCRAAHFVVDDGAAEIQDETVDESGPSDGRAQAWIVFDEQPVIIARPRSFLDSPDEPELARGLPGPGPAVSTTR